MNIDERLEVLAARVQRELSEEFPAWRILREVSGRWGASRPGWPTLRNRSAVQLREQIPQLHPSVGGTHEP